VPNPAAVVAINRRPVSTPWGGGNQWIDQITRSLRAHRYSVVYSLGDRVDCVLLVDPRSGPTASFDVPAIERMKTKRPALAVIQRVNDNDKHRGSDFRDAFHAAAHRIADHTVFLSQWLRDYEAGRWFDPVEPHSVIHNGADVRYFHSTGSAAWQPGQPFRLVTQHWSREWNKGFRVYRDIDEQIASGALAGVELWVIGRWPEDLIWRAARTFPAAGPRELGDLLRQCHAYVTASQWESGGMHFIEGAQCGLPVIYHVNGGGIVEVGRRFGVEFDADVNGAIRQMQQHYPEYRAAVLANPPSGDRMCDAYRQLIQRTIERKRDAA
jgi:glycosyltransferase involved in cell wall biosynthesis